MARSRPGRRMTHNLTGYRHHKCRCVECRKAHATAVRRYTQRKRARGVCHRCTEQADYVSPKRRTSGFARGIFCRRCALADSARLQAARDRKKAAEPCCA